MSNLPEVIADLEKLSALFSTEEKWTTKVCARGSDLLPVLPTSSEAFCFCLYGGIIHITQDNIGRRDPLIRFIADMLPPGKYTGAAKLTGFNDHHTYQEVKQLVDNSLQAARQLLEGEKA